MGTANAHQRSHTARSSAATAETLPSFHAEPADDSVLVRIDAQEHAEFVDQSTTATGATEHARGVRGDALDVGPVGNRKRRSHLASGKGYPHKTSPRDDPGRVSVQGELAASGDYAGFAQLGRTGDPSRFPGRLAQVRSRTLRRRCLSTPWSLSRPTAAEREIGQRSTEANRLGDGARSWIDAQDGVPASVADGDPDRARADCDGRRRRFGQAEGVPDEAGSRVEVGKEALAGVGSMIDMLLFANGEISGRAPYGNCVRQLACPRVDSRDRPAAAVGDPDRSAPNGESGIEGWPPDLEGRSWSVRCRVDADERTARNLEGGGPWLVSEPLRPRTSAGTRAATATIAAAAATSGQWRRIIAGCWSSPLSPRAVGLPGSGLCRSGIGLLVFFGQPLREMTGSTSEGSSRLAWLASGGGLLTCDQRTAISESDPYGASPLSIRRGRTRASRCRRGPMASPWICSGRDVVERARRTCPVWVSPGRIEVSCETEVGQIDVLLSPWPASRTFAGLTSRWTSPRRARRRAPPRSGRDRAPRAGERPSRLEAASPGRCPRRSASRCTGAPSGSPAS